MSDFSLKRMSCAGDPVADAVALRIDRRRPSQMMDEVHYLAKTEIGVYQEFVDHLCTLPKWIDWEKIEHARRLQTAFSHARSIAILTSSLLDGYCQNRASVALVMRGHLNHEVIRRVHETNYLIHSLKEKHCLQPGQPGQPGHRALSEIRLSNAMVRKSLLSRNWNENHKTTPLSQLDMTFDMFEFGHIANQGMERLGIQLQRDDKEAIHHFWRLCSYLYGVDDCLLTSDQNEEVALYQQLSQRQKHIEKEHQLLAKTTLECIAQQSILNIPNELMYAFSRVCLGNEKANALDIPSHQGWRRTANFYITANRGATFVHYHIPGMSGLNERINYYLSQNISIPPQENDKKPRVLKKIA